MSPVVSAINDIPTSTENNAVSIQNNAPLINNNNGLFIYISAPEVFMCAYLYILLTILCLREALNDLKLSALFDVIYGGLIILLEILVLIMRKTITIRVS